MQKAGTHVLDDSEEEIERKAFTFVKTLSTFISLQTVMTATGIKSCGKTDYMHDDEESYSLSNSSSLESAHAIPIKKRLY